jgi:hypothetical protein
MGLCHPGSIAQVREFSEAEEKGRHIAEADPISLTVIAVRGCSVQLL